MNFHKTDMPGGQGLVWNDFRFESAAVRDGFRAWASAFGLQPRDSYIMAGCTNSFTNGTDDTDGYTIAAGYIVINGEPCQVLQHDTGAQEPGTNTPIWVVVESDDPAGEKTFANTTVNQTYKVRTAQVVWASVTVGGNFMPMNAATILGKIAGTMLVKISLGTWNMDSTPSKTIPHGLTMANKTFVGAFGVVYSDDDLATRQAHLPLFSQYYKGYLTEVNETNIIVAREDGGIFDSADFNATSAHRGHVTLQFLPR